ncbi:MAG: hypothetical protein ACLFM0_01725 [Spirochaetales bacterium]
MQRILSVGIATLAEGGTPADALRQANRIAAVKCTREGIHIAP